MAKKPALLCLHGGGTNSQIFSIQMIRCQRVLSPYFEFVYLDGPLIGEAGPGVLPVFGGLEPFRSWTAGGGTDKPAVTDDLLRDAMEERRAEDGRGFVGVVGFSQGAKTAAGLLLEQQVRWRKEGRRGEGGLGFVVCLNGTSPPLTMGLNEEEKAEKIQAPALVVVGRDDPWREHGLELFERHFGGDEKLLLEFNVGHRLPLLEEDTKKITDWILRTWKSIEREHTESPAWDMMM